MVEMRSSGNSDRRIGREEEVGFWSWESEDEWEVGLV